MKNKPVPMPFGLQSLSKLTADEALALLEELRWPNGPFCPKCNSKDVTKLGGKSKGIYRCHQCPKRYQFRVTVGTIFEDSRIPLNKWLQAFALMCASKKSVSALQLKRMLELGSYETAWFMAARIRWAMQEEPLAGSLQGIVEVDETYVGGKPRYHRPYRARHDPVSRTEKLKTGRGTVKTPVIVLVERDGKAISHPVERVGAHELKGAIREHVDRVSTIMTDEFASYRAIGKEFDGGHQTVNHRSREYARGDAHVNTAESYFALMKRGIMGAYHHISKKHLPLYCMEYAFRWNTRKAADCERTMKAILGGNGKRMKYGGKCS